MNGVTESVVEQTALAWLESIGWVVRNGAEIAPGELAAERTHYSQVVLEQRLRDALVRLNPGLPVEAMANFALLEWPGNIDISDDPPSTYVPAIRPRFKPAEWQRMHELHALPDGWESLDYPEFLAARRRLMASIIRRGFEGL